MTIFIKRKYFSPINMYMNMKALPCGADLSQYRQFEVVKPFEVESSTIAPAFDKIGLGTRYCSSVSVEVLLKRDIYACPKRTRIFSAWASRRR